MAERPPPRFVAATDPALVTVPNVELLEVGDDWATSTGVFSFTYDDLVSAIQSQEDPAVRTPIVKLGHVDPRFDGQPSLGRIENLRLTTNGQTLIGDLVGVPAWLAKVMAAAYPRRSIEGWVQWETRTGNTWPFVLTGVALLGTEYPAIDTLEDLKVLWGEEAPPLYPADEVAEVVASHGALIRATRVEGDVPEWKQGGPPVSAASGSETNVPAPVLASVSVEDVRRNYYETLDGNQYWWWIRAVLLDPAELIVDDDEGGLYRVPYAVTGEGVTFGDPVSVKVEYVDVAATAGPVAASAPKVPVAKGQRVAASYTTPGQAGRPKQVSAATPEASPEASGTVTETQVETPKESGMTDKQREVLRKAHGLPDTATDEEILAAVTASVQQQADAPDPDPEGDGTGTGTDGNPDSQPETPATEPNAQPTQAPAAPEAQVPVAAGTPSVPEGMVLVDAATWEQVRQGAEAGATLAAAARKKEQDDLLDNAIRAGKFPKARRAHYEALLASDPTGGRATIESLAPGLVPVAERGVAASAETPTEETAYPASWGSTVQAARRGAGARVKVVSD